MLEREVGFLCPRLRIKKVIFKRSNIKHIGRHIHNVGNDCCATRHDYRHPNQTDQTTLELAGSLLINRALSHHIDNENHDSSSGNRKKKVKPFLELILRQTKRIKHRTCLACIDKEIADQYYDIHFRHNRDKAGENTHENVQNQSETCQDRAEDCPDNITPDGFQSVRRGVKVVIAVQRNHCRDKGFGFIFITCCLYHVGIVDVCHISSRQSTYPGLFRLLHDIPPRSVIFVIADILKQIVLINR